MEQLQETQKQFINTNNTNILVSASAGSGKTFTMVKKVVYLLKQNVDIENILVITYSKAAGDELKVKIQEELENEIEDMSLKNNVEMAEKLACQLEKINVANIGTLHSFCKNLIIKYFYKLNITPNFKVLSGNEEEFLFKEAMNNVFNKYIENKDEDFYEVYENFSKDRESLSLEEVINGLFDFMKSSSNYLDWYKDVLNKELNEDLNVNAVTTYLQSVIKTYLKGYLKTFKMLRDESEILGIAKFVDYLNNLLIEIKELIEIEDFENFVTNLFEYNKKTKPSKSNKWPIELTEFDDVLHKILDDFGEDLKKYKTMLVSADVEFNKKQIEKLGNILIKLNEILINVLDEFNKIKNDKSYINFSDMEQLTLKLLNDENLKKEISDSFEYIFVDEYQDINDIQEEILNLMAKPNNLNMIGDVKQSIYAFRLCSPEIFIKKYNSYKSDKSFGRALELNNNFRSENSILQFTNYIFEKIANKDTIGVDYDDNAALKCGNKFFKEIDYKNCNNVNVNIIDAGKLKTDETLVNEVYYIAYQIQELLGKTYINSKTGKEEYYKYKDIAILLRNTSKEGAVFYEIFKELNIPINIKVKSNIFETSEVQMLTAFLKLANNINDEISVATMLVSPIFGLAEKDLLCIKQYNSNDSFINNCASILKDDNVPCKYEKIKKTILNLVEEINKFKLDIMFNSIYDVTKKYIEKYNLINILKSEHGGGMAESNINAFLSMLNAENFNHNLTKFIDYIDSFEKTKTSEQKVASGVNAVTICTMHASKGLEWPAVFVANVGKSFYDLYSKGNSLVCKDFGVGLRILADKKTRFRTATYSFNACKQFLKIRDKKENIRLLYVALTRAKNYLNVVGSLKYDLIKYKGYFEPLKLNSFLDFILFALDKNQIEQLKENEQLNINYKHCAFRFKIIDNIDIDNVNNSANNIVIKENGDAVCENIIELINKKQNLKPNNIALKNSVTGILTEENDYENLQLSVSDFTVNLNLEKEKNYATSLGNAYHKVMQQVDYFSNNNVFEIINNLCKTDTDVLMNKDNINVSLIETCINKIKELISANCKILKEAEFLIKDEHCNLVAGSFNKTPIVVQGVIDLVLINPNGAIVIDFKTNKNTNAKHLKSLYATQLNLYSNAIEKAYKIKVDKKLIYSFFAQGFIEIK